MSVAVYARLSPRPDSGESIADQETWGVSYAAQTWPGQPVETFSDKKKSGTTLADRPGLAALLDAVAAERVSEIWVVEQSRLSRGEWGLIAPVLLAAGITHVHSQRSGLIEVDSLGADIQDVIAKREALLIRRRTADKIAELRLAGRHIGSVPFGYIPVGAKYHRRLAQVPEQAAEVRRAYERIVSGWSMAAIADDMNRRSVQTARGVGWRGPNLRKLLRSSKLAGLQADGRPLAADAVDPILTEDEWRHLQHVLDSKRVVVRMDGVRRIAIVEQGQRRPYALTGVLVCVAGCPMTGHAKTLPKVAPRPTYRCQHAQIPAVPVEEFVIGEYLAAVTKPAFLAALAEDNGAAQRQDIGAKLEALAAQRLALAGDLDLEPDEYATRRDAIRRREASLRATLADLPPAAGQADPEAVRDAWPYMTPGEQREFLSLWLDRVIVAPADRTAPRRFDRDRLVGRLTMVWRPGAGRR
jgi:DNA invertase Pin-like site-specific DNA recombinase